jgi:hypothetical protein
MAPGKPSAGVAIWILGENYADRKVVMVKDDATFEYELGREYTRALSPGQYTVVIQHPMYNNRFDIDLVGNEVRNLIPGGGITLFTLTGSGRLQGPAAAAALIDAMNSQNVDDMATSFSFLVNVPSSTARVIPDHFIGDVFTITGSTNLAAGDDILVEITSASFLPAKKTESSGFSGMSRMVRVVKGSDGDNRWDVVVDTKGFAADEYIVTAEAVGIGSIATTGFRLLPAGTRLIQTPPTIVVEVTFSPRTLVETVTPTTVPPPATTPESPLLSVLTVASLLAGVALIRNRG